MKRHWLINLCVTAAALAGAIIGYAALKPVRSSDTPPIKALLRPNLGDKITPQIVSFVIPIQNDSDREIRIAELVPACNCTSVTSSVSVLPPHKIAHLSIHYNNSAKRGGVDLLIYVIVRGYRKPFIADFVVNNVPECPDAVDMGTVLDKSSPATPILIRRRPEARTLEMTSLTYDRRYLSISASHDSSGNIVLKAHASDQAHGAFASVVQLRTNDAKQPLKKINIYGNVPAEIIASPSKSSLGLLKEGATVSGSFQILSPYGKKFALLSVDAPTADLSVSFDKSTVSAIHIVSFTYRMRRSKSQGVDIPVYVRTDLKEAPNVTERLFGLSL